MSTDADARADGTVTTEARGPVLVITLDRPRRRNAMTQAMAHELESALHRLDTEPGLRVGVLQGAGGYFCAGQDLAQAVAGTFARTVDRGWFGIIDRPPVKPLVAAIEGFALAGGLEIALACDLIVSADDAVFGIPEITNGQVAAARGLARLPLRLPFHVATRLALTGEAAPATLMHHHGLVSSLAAPGDALEVALDVAATIAAKPPVATALTLDAVRSTAAATEAAAWSRQASQLSVYALGPTAEYVEGVSAFLEKRPPSWAQG